MMSRTTQVLFLVAATAALMHEQPLFLGRISPVHAFSSVTHSNRYSRQVALKVASAFGPEESSTSNSDENHRRRTEFDDLGTIEESTERQRRIRREERNEQRFVKYGDDLWALRKLMNKLSRKLLKAINVGLRDEEMTIREQLRQAEQQDPEVVYKMEIRELKNAKMEGREQDAIRHSRNAYAARSCLPQFNLEGLWVGK
jgi:hypothetical protein